MSEGAPPPPAPNLTVNVTLNSAMDDQQTAYYAKLAEELIAKLPREMAAPPPPVAGEGVSDHLNVVTYLPSLADDPHSTGLDKRIQYFKVRFNFDGQNNVPVATIMDDKPAFVATATPMVSQTISDDGLGVASVLQPPKEDVPQPVEAPQPVLTQSDMIIVGAGKLERDKEKEEQEAAAAEERARSKAANEAKKQPKLAAPVPTDKAVPVVPVKTTEAEPPSENEVRLVFKADALELDDGERKKLIDFVKKSRAAGGIIGYNIVARTNAGPFGDLDWLGDERVRMLGGLMRQLGLDVYQGRLNEIHVTTQGEQFIEIEQIRG